MLLLLPLQLFYSKCSKCWYVCFLPTLLHCSICISICCVNNDNVGHIDLKEEQHSHPFVYNNNTSTTTTIVNKKSPFVCTQIHFGFCFFVKVGLFVVRSINDGFCVSWGFVLIYIKFICFADRVSGCLFIVEGFCNLFIHLLEIRWHFKIYS